MFTSFSTALSALNATSTAIDVVGNNLANLNTPGFKTSQVCFRDLVTQSLGAGLGETQVGFGTGQPLTVRQFTQGAIQTSSGLLDAAVQGDGFFVLKDDAGNTQFTRAGNFQADKSGVLLSDTGARVQGWTTVDATTGVINTKAVTVAAVTASNNNGNKNENPDLAMRLPVELVTKSSCINCQELTDSGGQSR